VALRQSYMQALQGIGGMAQQFQNMMMGRMYSQTTGRVSSPMNTMQATPVQQGLGQQGGPPSTPSQRQRRRNGGQPSVAPQFMNALGQLAGIGGTEGYGRILA
jgi:hypothetical protein